ncbi:ABC transporter substrate-binding protein [Telmatospirillum siberiense]|nr:ABC transporter substrate-binding protein [Telmatospirillum siberiense]
MTRAWRGVLAGMALCAGMWAGVAGAVDLTIGFIGDLSGPGANVAQDQLDGFRLAIKHLGGRIGGNEFGLIVADGRHDAKLTRQALDRMQQNDRLEFLLVSLSPSHIAQLLAPAVAGKTLVISLNSPPASMAGRDCSPSFFSLAGLTETMNDLSGQYLQQRGIKTLVVAGPDTPASRAALQALRRGFKGDITEMTSRRGEMDFSSNLRTIRSAAPDAVYLLHTGGMAVNFIRQSAEMFGKDRFPLFGPPSLIDQTLLAASGPAALGIGSIGFWSEDMDSPVNRRMQIDFESDYGRMASAYAAIGYDAAMLLDSALRAADKKNIGEDVLRTALRRVEIPSTHGAAHFDSNHFAIQTYVARQVVQDARDRMVDEQRGVFAKDVRDGHAGECPMRWTIEPPPKGP